MKIYDDAHKLAKQIRESKEYKEYKELKENIESNPVKKAQVEEFEHLRYKIQVETMQGNANSIADSVTALLYDHQLATNVSKKAKQKVKDQFNWEKIAQDTHFTYEKAICQTMAEKQAKQMLQEKAKKTEKAENSQKEITNLLSFKKRHAYA